MLFTNFKLYLVRKTKNKSNIIQLYIPCWMYMYVCVFWLLNLQQKVTLQNYRGHINYVIQIYHNLKLYPALTENQRNQCIIIWNFNCVQNLYIENPLKYFGITNFNSSHFIQSASHTNGKLILFKMDFNETSNMTNFHQLIFCNFGISFECCW